MQQYLISQGVNTGDIKILTDSAPYESPTRAAIEQGISWLVKGSGPGDSLFIHYSGHGSTFVEENQESDDRFAGAFAGGDEALCPVDFRTAGMIFDDEVFRHLIAPLPE